MLSFLYIFNKYDVTVSITAPHLSDCDILYPFSNAKLISGVVKTPCCHGYKGPPENESHYTACRV